MREGDEQSLKTGRLLLETSGIEAKEMADRVLRAAGNKEFAFVYPRSARMIYRLSRFLPRLFLQLKVKMFRPENRAKHLQRLEQKAKRMRN